MDRGVASLKPKRFGICKSTLVVLGIATLMLLPLSLFLPQGAAEEELPTIPTHWQIVENSKEFSKLVAEGIAIAIFWFPHCEECYLVGTESVLAGALPPAIILSYNLSYKDPLRKNLEIEAFPSVILYHDGDRVARWDADVRGYIDIETLNVELLTKVDSLSSLSAQKNP